MERVMVVGLDRPRRAMTLTLTLSMLLASLGTSIANIALPALTTAFSAPFARVQGIVVIYLATLTISVVIVGRLGDLHGLKRMLLVGLGLFGGASLLCSVAPNLWLLIGARAIQGVGAAFLMTLSMALMRETVDDARVGRAMGLLGTISAVGTALGPSLGGLLIQMAGWRGIFVMQIPLVVLTLVLAFVALPRDADKEQTPSSGLRAALRGNIVPNLLVNLLVAAVMMTTLVVGPFYLGLGLGLRTTLVGLVMSVGPAISIFCGVPSGRLVDAWGASRVLMIGLAMLTCGAFLLAIMPGVSGYVLAIVVLTPGYQLFQAANNTVTLAGVPKDRRGMTSGLLSLSRNVGLIGGASVMGAVFARGVGSEDFTRATSAAITGGMSLTFLLAGGLMMIAIAIAFGQRYRTVT